MLELIFFRTCQCIFISSHIFHIFAFTLFHVKNHTIATLKRANGLFLTFPYTNRSVNGSCFVHKRQNTIVSCWDSQKQKYTAEFSNFLYRKFHVLSKSHDSTKIRNFPLKINIQYRWSFVLIASVSKMSRYFFFKHNQKFNWFPF